MRLRALLSAAVLFAGCQTSEPSSAVSVKHMAPGYGVMVASFKYVPGESKFPQSQVIYDAKYTAGRLAAVGYQAFVVYRGGNWARVGIRAPSRAAALALKRKIDHDGFIDLKDGRKLKAPITDIINIAELRPGAVEDIK